MFALVLALAAPIAAQDSVLLHVLTINDFHGALESRTTSWSQGRPVGGIAAVKGLMDSLEGACRCPVLRLDAGDQLQGTLGSNLVHGRSTVAALNVLGLNAAAIGNHEFDWGVDTLRARILEARYPWLAANIVDSATGQSPAWVRSAALIATGGIRVGVVGYITPQTKTIVMERFVRGLAFRTGRAALSGALAEIGQASPDLTIIVAHEGAYCDNGCRGEIVDLARQLEPGEVDLIVAGHTHSLINTVVNGIPIVSARANGVAVGIADWVLRADGSKAWSLRVVDVYADAIRPDSAAAALVEQYRPLVDRLGKRVIARLRDSLVSTRSESALGNLIADAQRRAGRADFGIMNNGGIRRSLLPGPVRYADLFELHPFGNAVVTVQLTGAELKEALEHSVAGGRPDLHVSGMTVRYDPNRPVGQRIVGIRRPDGRAIRQNGRYRLALSDFLAGGGNGYLTFTRLPSRRTGLTDLDAMIVQLRRLPQPVRVPVSRRWIAESTP